MNSEKKDNYFFLVNYLVDTATNIETKFFLLHCINHYRKYGFFTEGQKFLLFKEFNCA